MNLDQAIKTKNPALEKYDALVQKLMGEYHQSIAVLLGTPLPRVVSVVDKEFEDIPKGSWRVYAENGERVLIFNDKPTARKRCLWP